MRRLLALVALLAACGACAGDDDEADLVIRAARVFDGTRMVADASVVVRDRRIAAVGRDVGADGRRTIELGNATVLPGFIDLHVHTGGSYELVDAGVTTVRDLGNSRYLIGVARRGETGRLRVLAAGPLLTAPGGYPVPAFGPETAFEVRGPRAAREAVAGLARDGAAVIKVALEPGLNGDWPMLTPSEVRAIVSAAHRRDLRVTAHVTDERGAGLALAGGVDELAHMPCRQEAPDVMRALAGRGIEIVGTLRVVADVCPYGGENARVFVAAGGRLLYGSDWSLEAPVAINPSEIRLMIEAGLTPLEVLRTATAVAGRYLGLEPLGQLVEGAPADLFAVRGDPLADRSVLSEPVLVVADGELIVDTGG
ncbi:MAG: amidohydrolase family protein [Gaiellaceae bacterium]